MGEQVRLRPVRPEDAAPYVQAFIDDPHMARLVGFPAPTVRSTRAAFKRDARDRAAGRCARFAVTDPGFLGVFLLHSFSWEHRRADVGFLVVPAGRGRGVALESLRLITRWALATLGLQRVGLATLEENVATKRLAAAAGYVREGVLRAYTRERDEPIDNVVFSVVA